MANRILRDTSRRLRVWHPQPKPLHGPGPIERIESAKLDQADADGALRDELRRQGFIK